MSSKLSPLLKILSDRYAFAILEQACDSSGNRFCDFEDTIPGISTRTLTKRLNAFVDQGLLTRCRYREKPPRVEYCLTPKGREFQSLIKGMARWSEKHLTAKIAKHS
jgi:DNA-binding HxlR family transcriptional regulator